MKIRLTSAALLTAALLATQPLFAQFPSIPSVPSIPSAPSTPSAPSLPSIPGLPSSDGLRQEAPDQPSEKVGRNGQPDAGFVKLHEQYVAQAKAGNIDLYMLGDSITDFWQHRNKANWDQELGGWKAADFGISGDRTQHVLWRLQNGELDNVNPKAIVLLIGTNNLPNNAVYAENTVDDTFKGVKAIVDVLKEKAPNAHILLLAVFPREDKAVSTIPLAIKIRDLNALLATLEDGKLVKYLNINDKFTDKDGKLLPGVMLKDNLHPTAKGYTIWAQAMKPTLTDWLGAPTETTK